MDEALNDEILRFNRAVLPIEQNNAAFDLSLNQGDVLIVSGPDSSGKTSFIKSILGLVNLYEGEISLFGKNLATLSASQLQSLRKKTGLVMAKDGLIDSWVIFENLLLPLLYDPLIRKEKRSPLITRTWERYGFAKRILWKPVANLNPEMRQKISFIRALIKDPKILIVDGFQPLDIDDEEIEQFIKPYLKNSNSTLVINGHPSLARAFRPRHCKFAVIMDSVVAGFGSYQQLLYHSSAAVRSWIEQEAVSHDS